MFSKDRNVLCFSLGDLTFVPNIIHTPFCLKSLYLGSIQPVLIEAVSAPNVGSDMYSSWPIRLFTNTLLVIYICILN